MSSLPTEAVSKGSKKEKAGSDPDRYLRQEDDTYKCRDCGAIILQKFMGVATVWDESSPCSGGGETEPIYAPFCPNCEEEPS